ncbi:uncharacterized protein LOC135689174 isoform X2 [Rhopilema esculentum]|uniref:uncharacterized protein LOC135689174 isoform X2 n=2 Tax=Rhopilema esculentum TaxID=499914 RepID=UPI0031CFBD2A
MAGTPSQEGSVANGKNNVLKRIWSETVDHKFNVLKVGKVFKDIFPSMVTGGEDGILKVHQCTINEGSKLLSGFETGHSLETKSGPIQRICFENVTNFNSTDILVGDSKGMLTIFTNNQILSRRSLIQSSIASITIEKDSAGNMKILLGSLDGTVLAVSPYSTLWKLRLPDILQEKCQGAITSFEITSILNQHLVSGSTDATYTVVADNKCCLHFFQSGTLVRTLKLPSVALCMCSGYFIPMDPILTPVPTTPMLTSTPGFSSPTRKTRLQGRMDDQIAVGTADGKILIVSGPNIVQYGNIGTRITNIHVVRGAYDGSDLLICSGHFNFLSILQDGKELTRYKTVDWIHTFDILIHEDSNKYIVIGCLDSKIEILKLDF